MSGHFHTFAEAQAALLRPCVKCGSTGDRSPLYEDSSWEIEAGMWAKCERLAWQCERCGHKMLSACKDAVVA